MIMQPEPIQNDLLVTLLGCYEENPEQFLTLPKQTVDSSSARVMVAELRNEGGKGARSDSADSARL